MKTLSVKQPWASLIVHGQKNIENRTWRTDFRGKVLIHSSAKPDNAMAFRDDTSSLDLVSTYPTSAIIGEVEIVGCVKNHESDWAEQSQEGEKPIWNWILANPVLYPEPIENVKGKLGFWEYGEK